MANKKKWVISFILAFILVIVLTLTLFRPIFMTQKRQDINLTILPQGKHSENSWGNEIRIAEIKVNDELLDLPSLISDINGWNMNGDILFTLGEDAQPLTILLNDVEILQIKFIGQRGSGTVEISSGKESKSIDLFRDSDWEAILCDIPREEEFIPWARLDLVIELTLILSLLVFLVMKITDGKNKKNL